MTAEAAASGLTVSEMPLQHSDGMVYGKKIAIRSGQTSAEKACVLAEELSHVELTVGNILDQSSVSNRKQENLARAKAYDRLIGLSGLVDAFEHGCKTYFETAEHLEITEKFLKEAMEYYRKRYGCYVKFKNYTIHFEPRFAIVKYFG